MLAGAAGAPEGARGAGAGAAGAGAGAAGAELKPRNLVLAGAGAAGAGAAGAGADPPRPLVNATCGSVYVCMCGCFCLCVCKCIQFGDFRMSTDTWTVDVCLTGHGHDNGGNDEEGRGDEAEVFHFEKS